MMRIPTPWRTLRRLVATIASCGMLGQGVLGAALSLPVLMIATPAQAAPSCSGTGTPMLAMYQTGTNLDALTTRMFGSCSGLTAAYSQVCFNSGSSSSAGKASNGLFQARSAAGNLIQFDIVTNYNGYYSMSTFTGSGRPVLLGGGPDSNGNMSWSTDNQSGNGLRLLVGNQTVTAGDYTAIVQVPVVFRDDSGWGPYACLGAVQLSFVATVNVTIRVAGTCDIATVQAVNFGMFTATNGNLNAGTMRFWIPVACAVNQSYTLTISDGRNAQGSGNYRRRMVNGSSYIAYGLFTDSAASTPFPVSGRVQTGTGVADDQTNWIYASVGSSQATAGLAAGTYSDTLVAAVSW